MRVATWNLKQAVAPKAGMPALVEWLDNSVAPDVAVLTEAKLPPDPIPGWAFVGRPGGIGPRRRWGTVVAGRGVELREVTSVGVGRRKVNLDSLWPGTVVVCDVITSGERWATIVGLYAITLTRDGRNIGRGDKSMRILMRELDPLFASDRGERIVLCADLNCWPCDRSQIFERRGLVDVIEYTADERDPLDGCVSCTSISAPESECGHLWTHRNGGGKNPARQQLDFIFASKAMMPELGRVYGGDAAFPHAWDVSDHAPVVAEFATC